MIQLRQTVDWDVISLKKRGVGQSGSYLGAASRPKQSIPAAAIQSMHTRVGIDGDGNKMSQRRQLKRWTHWTVDSPIEQSDDSPSSASKTTHVTDNTIGLAKDVSIPAHHVTKHIAHTLVRCNLTINSCSFFKMMNLGNFRHAGDLHETLNHRFEHALQGRTITEIAFVFVDREFAISPDESGQMLYEELLQVMLDDGLKDSFVFVELRV
jgi:hypothetical protein